MVMVFTAMHLSCTYRRGHVNPGRGLEGLLALSEARDLAESKGKAWRASYRIVSTTTPTAMSAATITASTRHALSGYFPAMRPVDPFTSTW